MEVRQADLEGKRKGGGSLVTVGFGGWVGGGGGVVIFRGWFGGGDLMGKWVVEDVWESRCWGDYFRVCECWEGIV